MVVIFNMKLIIFGDIIDTEVTSFIASDDEIVSLWSMDGYRINIDELYQEEKICVLLIHGNYSELLSECVKYGIPIIRILNNERYQLFKSIEKELCEKSEGDFLRGLYEGLKKIIDIYEKDNQTVWLCKHYFDNEMQKINFI